MVVALVECSVASSKSKWEHLKLTNRNGYLSNISSLCSSKYHMYKHDDVEA